MKLRPITASVGLGLYAALDVEDRRKSASGDLVILKPFELNAVVGAIESMLPQPG